MEVAPVKVGVIGCGNIAPAYLRQCPLFEILEVAAVADVLPERAEARAEEFKVPQVCTPEELLADPEIELVINLTVPQAHYEVSLAAIAAGKSVWSEKPIALERAQARKLLDESAERGVLVGCAPDTFLGGAHQTCIKLISDGVIGAPVGASAFMMGRGPESWHPNPYIFYQRGAGPMFDMGPYYLTALIAMLGPVWRVTGATRISFPERVIGSEPHKGKKIQVEVPTHVTGILDFASGAIGTLTTSFDVWAHELPNIEIYGSEGTLSVPDPNGPGGTPRLWTPKTGKWTEVPLTHGYAEVSRSTGVADMAYALRHGRDHRASGLLAYHVLDLMQAFHDASNEDRHIEMESTCERPAPLPVGLKAGTLDE